MISDDRLGQLLTTTAMPAPIPAEPVPEPMSEREFEAAVRRLVENARSLMDSDALAPLDRSWRYYNGEVDQTPMGKIGTDAETGEDVYEGSKAVLTECRDQVQALIPEIYRALAGSEEAVIFKPVGPEDTAYVEQANDYIRHLFWDKNDGETLVKDGLLDWCVKYAAYRVWREESTKEHVKTLEGIDETQLFALMQDQSLTVEAVEPYEVSIALPQVQPDGSIVHVQQATALHRVQCRYSEPVGRTRVELIPQDELLLDLEAQDFEQATVIGIDAERRVSDLIAMGLDPEKVRNAAGQGLRRGGRSPSIQRHRANIDRINRASRDHPDDSLWWVRTVDARVLVDRNGDGIAEPWRIIAVGEPLEIVEAVEDPGSDTIVVGSPLPRPHYLIGEGIVENVVDLQEIGSGLVRGVLNSFNRANDPRLGVSGGSETIFDDLDSWHSGPIDLGRDGRIDVVQVPFNGAAALPLMEFFQQRRVLRSGISPAAQGLDPNALKGQTVEGAGAIVAGPQSRSEGYAREFATRILKEIFRAMLRLTVMYQDRPEVIRLRDEFVTVDPRGWNADMDAEVHIGTGTRQERIAALMAIIAKQEQLFAAKSKLFDLKKYRQALADLAHEMGVKDDERYFPPVDDEMIARSQAEAQQEQQMALQMQAAIKQAEEGAKAQAEIAVEQAKAQFDQRQAVLDSTLKRQEQELVARLERMELAQKQAGEAQLLRLEAALEAMVARAMGRDRPASTNANIERRS